MSTPALILKVKFMPPSNKKFNKYIDYIDRNEATRKNNFKSYSLYNDYMDNSQKLGSLFTASKDYLNEDEKKNLKELYKIAQDKNSIMWQDVFSFDNNWLIENGLYDEKTNALDEDKIRNAVRVSMENLIEKEGYRDLIWSSSLHYNTDNIHVHIASVELNPSRSRGKRKPKTIQSMKSKFLNNLIDKQKDLQKINDIIRKNIIKDKHELFFLEDIKMKIQVKNIITKLPSDTRQWKYNYNSLSTVKPLLNDLSKYYIENYKSNEYSELIKLLDKQEKFLKDLYGDGNSEKYKEYKKNKINDLYTRLGNDILKEIKVYVKGEDRKNQTKTFKKSINKDNIIRLKNMFHDDINSFKNELAYEKLQRQLENEYRR